MDGSIHQLTEQRLSSGLRVFECWFGYWVYQREMIYIWPKVRLFTALLVCGRFSWFGLFEPSPQPNPTPFGWIGRDRNTPNYLELSWLQAVDLFLSSLSAFNCPWWHLVMVTYVCCRVRVWVRYVCYNVPSLPPSFSLCLTHTHIQTLQCMIRYRNTPPTNISPCIISPECSNWKECVELLSVMCFGTHTEIRRPQQN